MQDHTVETPQGARLDAPPTDRGPRLSNRTRESIAGYLFVAPDAIGLMIFVGGPMILSLSLGFFSVSGFGDYTLSDWTIIGEGWAIHCSGAASR